MNIYKLFIPWIIKKKQFLKPVYRLLLLKWTEVRNSCLLHCRYLTNLGVVQRWGPVTSLF